MGPSHELWTDPFGERITIIPVPDMLAVTHTWWKKGHFQFSLLFVRGRDCSLVAMRDSWFMCAWHVPARDSSLVCVVPFNAVFNRSYAPDNTVSKFSRARVDSIHSSMRTWANGLLGLFMIQASVNAEEDNWTFDHYVPSQFETLWVNNINAWKDDICVKLMEGSQDASIESWISGIGKQDQLIKDVRLKGSEGFGNRCISGPVIRTMGTYCFFSTLVVAMMVWKVSFQQGKWPAPICTLLSFFIMGFFILDDDELSVMGRPWPVMPTGLFNYLTLLCLVCVDIYFFKRPPSKMVSASLLKTYSIYLARSILVVGLTATLVATTGKVWSDGSTPEVCAAGLTCQLSGFSAKCSLSDEIAYLNGVKISLETSACDVQDGEQDPTCR